MRYQITALRLAKYVCRRMNLAYNTKPNNTKLLKFITPFILNIYFQIIVNLTSDIDIHTYHASSKSLIFIKHDQFTCQLIWLIEGTATGY